MMTKTKPYSFYDVAICTIFHVQDYWSRSSDGGLPVTRETMLHVLKNIRQFFVRISYATEVETVTYDLQ